MKQTKAELLWRISVLERDNARMRKMLEWFKECKAEATFDPEGDKWKTDLLNEVAIKPVNRKAEQFLSELETFSV